MATLRPNPSRTGVSIEITREHTEALCTRCSYFSGNPHTKWTGGNIRSGLGVMKFSQDDGMAKEDPAPERERRWQLI